MRIAFLVALITSGLVLHVGRAQFLTGPITNPSNGHQYYLTATINWTGAEALALTVGGHLATVRNSAENAWIFDTFAAYGGTDRFLWIGLSDAVTTGQYLWTSGESSSYRNWAIGEPNHLDGLDHYVEMYPANAARGPGYPPADPGTWNDAPDSSWPYQGSPSGNNFGPIFGVVEVVPEPSFGPFVAAWAVLGVVSIRSRACTQRIKQ